MWFTITRKGDILTVCNKHISNIDIKVLYDDLCTPIQEISSIVLEPTQASDIPLYTKKEGVYIVKIESDNNVIEYKFPYFKGVLDSLLLDIEQVLCKDKNTCTTCNNKVGTSINKDENFLEKALNKAFLYYMLVNKYYSPYLDLLSKNLKCMVLKDFSCLTMQEFITGKSNSVIFKKRFLSLLYLTFFFAEKEWMLELQDTDSKFNYNNLKDCLVGIPTDFLSDIYEERIGLVDIGNLEKTVNKGTTYVFTQKDFIDLTRPSYYSSKNDKIEFIKISKAEENVLSRFLYKNQPVKRGDIIPFREIGLGALKYEAPPIAVNITHQSILHFSVKTLLAEEYTKTSKITIKSI